MEGNNMIIWFCLLAILQPLCPVEALTGKVCYYAGTYQGSRTTSCGFLGWWRRTVYFVKYETRQRCCDGWRQNGEACNTPICSTPCYNGGTCIGPEKCSCPSSHAGQYCSTLLCSYRSPCYPGACSYPDRCTCSTGYSSTSSSTTSRCLTFTSANPAPTIDRCEHTFAHIRRTDNKQLFYFRSLCGDIQTKDVFWTNQALFNWVEFTLTSSYHHVANMPPRPSYVSDSKFGIVKMSVDVLHTKVNRNGTYGPLQTVKTEGGGVAYVAYRHEYVCANGTSDATPISPTAFCSIKEKDYTTSLEHGDNLTATFITKSGGFRHLRNTDTRRHHTTDYFQGRETQKKIVFRLDFIAPVHCSKAAVKCPDGAMEPLYLSSDITKDPVTVTWGGWSDEMSGIWYYYLELFLLSLNIHGDLLEMKPLQPVLSFEETNVNAVKTVHSHVFTPPKAGMYSVLLRASDHANNSRIARRLVLYDNTSELTISKPGFVMTNDEDPEGAIVGDGGMYVTTAVAETGYRWQTSSNGSSTHFILDWQNHFRNLIHEKEGLLRKVMPFPIQFQNLADDGILRSSKVVDSELDDREGRRTMEPIANINGAVKFQFRDISTADRTEPTFGWLDLPLSEQYSFKRILSSGSFLRLWIKATDVLNNTIADYTEVHIDNTPPIYSQEKLTINVQNSTFLYTSIVTMEAVDHESGVHKLAYDIYVENQTKPLKSGMIFANRNNESDACSTDTNCRCSLGQCFLMDQTIYLDNCWFMVPKEELDSPATVTVHVYNQALLKTSFSVPINKLSDLNGLEEYSGPTNIRVMKKLPYGVRLAWDLPPTASCYGRADIVILLYQTDGTVSVHNIYNEATTYDLVGLEPDVAYSMSLNLQYDGNNLAAMPYRFQTAPQENYLSGGIIAGIVVGILLIIGILLGVFAVLLRRGHMQPVSRGLRAMSVRYQRTVASARNRMSTFGGSGKDTDRESLYMYGDMDFSASKSSHMTRDDVVLESLLKSGNFADIFLARLHSNSSSGQLVAKVLKDGHSPDDEYLMRAKINFTSIVVGQHENIVRFVGAVVSESEIGPFMVYEYCCNGTLKTYLVEFKENVTEELHENLFRFGLGIVRGMAYLAEKKIVHRRLAARNILLDSALCAKIHGFGPQPDEKKEKSSKDKTTDKRERIPIRWCAPECLKSTLGATEKSDVWSYGIVLWEIFSLGENPYGHIQGRDLPARVKAGEKMKKPELCDDKWYGVMTRAWNLTPNKRPAFKAIRDELDEMFVASPTEDYYFYRR